MSNTQDQQSMVKVVYVLYLVSIMTGGLTALIGAVIAYVYYSGADEPMRDHFQFQIRTFWMGLLYTIICGATIPVLIGFLLSVLLVIWILVRCGKGLSAMGKQLPPDDVMTWWL